MTSWNVQCYSVWEVFSCMSVEFAILVHQFWLCRDIPSTLDTHHSWLTHSPGLWCLQLPTSTTVLQGASFSVAPHEPETHPRMYLWVKAYVNISFYQELADCSAEWGSNFTIMLAVARFSFFHVLANAWQFWAILMNVKIYHIVVLMCVSLVTMGASTSSIVGHLSFLSCLYLCICSLSPF